MSKYISLPKIGISEYLRKIKYGKWFKNYDEFFKNKKGFEVGGPSGLFSGSIIPVYELANTIDGCNFSSSTVWEGNITSDDYRYYKNKKGKQFISEGSDLRQIEDEQYDFLLSCHNLEHIANPIKAVKEWQRVVKKGGALLLVLPDKRFTFDKKRPYTTFSHLLDDFKNDIGENDLTHLPETLQLHCLELDPGSGKDFERFRQRGELNFENRCLHHHVFSQDVLGEIFTYLGIEIISQQFIPTMHQVIIGKK